MGIELNVSLTVADSVFFYNGSTNKGTITAGGSIVFFGSSKNSGTINAAAVFNDTSENTGTINGSATFNGAGTNNSGTVNGPQTYDPPLRAKWILLKWAPDEPWLARKIGTYRGVYSGTLQQDYPYQACPYPNEGCYTQPELYRQEFPNLPDFILDDPESSPA